MLMNGPIWKKLYYGDGRTKPSLKTKTCRFSFLIRHVGDK